MNAPSTSRFPTFHKAGAFIGRVTAASARRARRLFLSRTSLKVYLITATLVCLTYTSLRWMGRHALKAEKARVVALGMATEESQLPPPPAPPDEENFFAAPPFTGRFTAEQLRLWWPKSSYKFKKANGHADYRQLIIPKNGTLAEWCEAFRRIGLLPTPPVSDSPALELLADQRWDPIVPEIYAAASRPFAALPAHNAGINPDEYMYGLYNSLKLYARAQLETGNVAQALPYFRINRHRVHAWAAQPRLGIMKASHALDSQKSLLLEGMLSHQWPESVLEALKNENYPTLMETAARRSLEHSRMDTISFYEHASLPDSIYAKSGSFKQVFWKLITPDYYFSMRATHYSRIFAELHTAARPLGHDENWNSRVAVMNGAPVPAKLTWMEISLDQRSEVVNYRLVPLFMARLQHLAVALELHHLRHQRYPAKLEELVPSVPLAMLMDTDGQPISYTTNAEGTHFTMIPVRLDLLIGTPYRTLKPLLVYSTDPERLPK
jgi:hypothetical protein